MRDEDDNVLKFLPWATRYARKCCSQLPPHLDHEDLEAAGVMGYLQAAARYKKDHGATFRTYCAARIRGAVLDELRRWDWAPRSVHQNHKRVTVVTLALYKSLEREPTAPELAAALGVGEDELAPIQADAQLHKLVSFDELSENPDGEDNLTLTERLPDLTAARPDERLRTEDDRRMLMRCIQRLPKTQAMVIVLHYVQNVPLCEVARLLTVTPSRVSQMHRRALGHLRQVCPAMLRAA